MTTYIFDIETNGFLEDLDRIHSLVLKDVDTGETISCAADRNGEEPGGEYMNINVGLKRLAEADMIIGHNIIKFDIPAIQKVCPCWSTNAVVRDTLLLGRLQHPEIKKSDFKRFKKGNLTGNLIGRHSLEAWGHRLGLWKGDYSVNRKDEFIIANGPRKDAANKPQWDKDLSDYVWGTWNPEMQSYCEQDVEVNHALWMRLNKTPYAEKATELEHKFATLMFMQEQAGFPFDEEAAAKLYSELKKKCLKIESDLQTIFPPRVIEMKSKYAVSPNGVEWESKKAAVKAGHPDKLITWGRNKTKSIPFNPGSRDEIARRFKEKYDWQPEEFTAEGKAKVDETVLGALDYEEAVPLTRYLLLSKRVGQLAEGRKALLKHVKEDGCIHGSIATVGAVTRRCTHASPNVAQVPKVGSEYGEEFRSLFTSVPGYLLVGCDAAGIELRMLGHYMAKHDGGAYIKAVVEGKQSAGTDVHSLNAKALGLDPTLTYKLPGGRTAKGRDLAKTFIYAFLYGAGDFKLGSILGKGAAHGKRLKARFLNAFPALKKLKTAIDKKSKEDGYLKAIDGGRLTIRHSHAALNTLLQAAGSIVVKKATILFYESVISHDYVWGEDFWIVAHIHDEFQTLVKKDIADEVGELAVQAIRQAGIDLGVRCPLDGEYKAGRTWAETH